MLEPRVNGTRLTITLGDDEQELSPCCKSCAGEPITGARLKRLQLAQRMNQFKQVAPAMHNFTKSAKRRFQHRRTICRGKPLLSWRVHILPFLEEGELYKQFRLDEPWDSEHNRKLIEKMPDAYADPDSAVRKRSKGRATRRTSCRRARA